MDLSDRHPATRDLMRWFDPSHLDERGPVWWVVKRCQQLAVTMVENLDDGAELSAGLRRLLEAKDAFARQAVRTAEEAEAKARAGGG
jgi:hypothetical protein